MKNTNFYAMRFAALFVNVSYMYVSYLGLLEFGELYRLRVESGVDVVSQVSPFTLLWLILATPSVFLVFLFYVSVLELKKSSTDEKMRPVYFATVRVCMIWMLLTICIAGTRPLF